MFIEIEQILPKTIIKGYEAKFIHGETMTLAFWEVKAGAEMPMHHHIHEQTSQVLEGKFELSVGNERKVLEPGTVAVIGSGILHGGIAVTDCKLLDIFSPVRQDYQL